jgi:hypothetical protein
VRSRLTVVGSTEGAAEEWSVGRCAMCGLPRWVVTCGAARYELAVSAGVGGTWCTDGCREVWEAEEAGTETRRPPAGGTRPPSLEGGGYIVRCTTRTEDQERLNNLL